MTNYNNRKLFESCIRGIRESICGETVSIYIREYGANTRDILNTKIENIVCEDDAVTVSCFNTDKHLKPMIKLSIGAMSRGSIKITNNSIVLDNTNGTTMTIHMV